VLILAAFIVQLPNNQAKLLSRPRTNRHFVDSDLTNLAPVGISKLSNGRRLINFGHHGARQGGGFGSASRALASSASAVEKKASKSAISSRAAKKSAGLRAKERALKQADRLSKKSVKSATSSGRFKREIEPSTARQSPSCICPNLLSEKMSNTVETLQDDLLRQSERTSEKLAELEANEPHPIESQQSEATEVAASPLLEPQQQQAEDQAVALAQEDVGEHVIEIPPDEQEEDPEAGLEQDVPGAQSGSEDLDQIEAPPVEEEALASVPSTPKSGSELPPPVPPTKVQAASAIVDAISTKKAAVLDPIEEKQGEIGDKLIGKAEEMARPFVDKLTKVSAKSANPLKTILDAKKDAVVKPVLEKKAEEVAPVLEEKAEKLETKTDAVLEPLKAKVEGLVEPILEKKEQVLEPLLEKTAEAVEKKESSLGSAIEKKVEAVEQKGADVLKSAEEAKKTVLEPIVEKNAEFVEKLTKKKTEIVEDLTEEKTELVEELAEKKAEVVDQLAEKKGVEAKPEPIKEAPVVEEPKQVETPVTYVVPSATVSLQPVAPNYVPERPLAQSFPLYPSPKVSLLPEKCRANLFALQELISDLLALIEKIMLKRLLLAKALSYQTRGVIVTKLTRIKTLAIEARMAANLGSLRALNVGARALGLELIRLTSNLGMRKLAPNLRNIAVKFRRRYSSYRKSCKGFE